MESYRPMRMAPLEVTDEKRIEEFLSQAEVGYLGLIDAEGTYVVPLNYAWHQGCIYFHGADAGRKADALRTDRTLCFTAMEHRGTIAHPVPAKTDTAYLSVMVFGQVQEVEDLEEATAAMQTMLDKYVPGYFPTPLAKGHVDSYRSRLGSRIAVYKIIPERITAKENQTPAEQLFYPGRKQVDDLQK